MSANVFVANEQSDHPIDVERWTRLANNVLEDLSSSDNTELSVLFVDRVTITELNDKFLGRTGPTDVLSFPLEEDFSVSGRSPDSGSNGPESRTTSASMPMLIGDVIICPGVAFENYSKIAIHTFEDEIALLLVHGILHLAGMDHTDSSDEDAMKAKENELLNRLYTNVTAEASSQVRSK